MLMHDSNRPQPVRTALDAALDSTCLPASYHIYNNDNNNETKFSYSVLAF